jgi:hypothetical protein
MLWLLLVPGDRVEVWHCVARTIRILIVDDPGGVGGVGIGCHGRMRVDNEGVFVFCGKECMLRNMPTSVVVKILFFQLGNLAANFELGNQVR